MVSYGDLIYQFTDGYLETAMECSFCKESYEMTDDRGFLDEYLKFFSSLLLATEEQPELSLEDIQKILKERRQDKLQEFWFFLKRKIAEEAIESVGTLDDCEILSPKTGNDVYTQALDQYLNAIFDEESIALLEYPAELLKLIRKKEEQYGFER